MKLLLIEIIGRIRRLLFSPEDFFLGLKSRKKNQKTYLFLAINGAGLGHLTRCLAIAKKVKAESEASEIIFVTTSVAVQLVHQHGFLCYHIPPFGLNSDVTSRKWNRFFGDSLSKIVRLHCPDVLVFDGTYIYRGLRRVMEQFPFVKYIWIRRGGGKERLGVQFREMESLFSQVIIPGEIDVDSAETLGQKITRIPPVLICGKSEMLGRTQARERLGVAEDKIAVYLQLGAGNINDINTLEASIKRFFATRDKYQLIVARSPISIKNTGSYSVGELKDFPNSIYFNAFDIAISACGYNSVAELVSHQVPSILLPNTSTGLDDQVRRAQLAAVNRYIKVMLDFDEQLFSNNIEELVTVGRSTGEDSSGFSNGAIEAARLIVNGQ